MTFLRTMLMTTCALLTLAACNEDADDVATLTYEDIQAKRDSYGERIGNISDPAARETLQSALYEVAYLLELGLSVRRPLHDITYVTDPFAVIDDYASPDAMAAQYAGGLIPFTNPAVFRGDVNVHQPFTYPFQTQIIWSEITLADGTVMSVNHDPFAQTDDGFEARNRGRSLDMVAEGDDVPLAVQAVGQIDLQVPTDVQRLRLGKDDLGTPQTVGNYIITMTALTQTSAVVDISPAAGAGDVGAPNPMYLSATDKTGQYLNSNATTSSRPKASALALDAAFEQVLTTVEAGDLAADAVFDKLRSEFSAIESTFDGAFTVQSNFEGIIETVEVMLATDIQVRSFDLDLPVQQDITQVAFTDDFVPFDLPVDTVSFAHELTYLTAPDLMNDLTAEQLDGAITPVSSIFWDGQERVKFFYPPNMASSLFTGLSGRMEPDTAQINFLDARSKPVDPQPPFEFQSGRLEFDVADGAARPQSVSGSIDLRLMDDITVETFPSDALPAGVSIAGNKVIRAPSDAKVYAIDAAGRFLRSFHELEVKDGWDVVQVVEYYYGAPTGVVVVTPGTFTPHPYAFAVDLVEPTPEEQR